MKNPGLSDITPFERPFPGDFSSQLLQLAHGLAKVVCVEHCCTPPSLGSWRTVSSTEAEQLDGITDVYVCPECQASLVRD